MLHENRNVHIIMSAVYVQNKGMELGDIEDDEKNEDDGGNSKFDAVTTEKIMVRDNAMHFSAITQLSSLLNVFQSNGQKPEATIYSLRRRLKPFVDQLVLFLRPNHKCIQIRFHRGTIINKKNFCF